MAQDDLSVANGSGAAVRADINNQLQALGTLMSGTSGPSTTYPYMLWADTTNGLLKQRNGANSAWITLWTLSDPSATTSAEGLIELATAAETLTGSDSSRALTASGFAGNKSLATTGYYKFPGGLIIQWGAGTLASVATAAVSFSPSFTTLYGVYISNSNPASSGDNIYTTSESTTGFTAGRDTTTGSGSYYWIAVGA